MHIVGSRIHISDGVEQQLGDFDALFPGQGDRDVQGRQGPVLQRLQACPPPMHPAATHPSNHTEAAILISCPYVVP